MFAFVINILLCCPYFFPHGLISIPYVLRDLTLFKFPADCEPGTTSWLTAVCVGWEYVG